MTQNNDEALLKTQDFIERIIEHTTDGWAKTELREVFNFIEHSLEQSPTSQNEQQEAVGEVVNERGYSEVFVDFFDKPPPPNGTKLYTSPPKQIPDRWKPSEKEILKYASEEELFLFADESDLLGIANGILELVQIKINASPTTSLTSETNTEVVE